MSTAVEPVVETSNNAVAFPTLSAADLASLRPLGKICKYEDGQVVFRAGDADIDLFVVESGAIDILNPADGDKLIVSHTPGQFSGDIDLLTRRPVIVTAVANGPTTVLRVPGARLREVLNKVPSLSEKMLLAIQERRRMLTSGGTMGLKVVGPGKCRDTTAVREFLFKNFVPFNWIDSEAEAGKQLLVDWGSPKKTPVIELGNRQRLLCPTLRELAHAAGVWRHVPEDIVDLAVIGGGPAGMAAAVYAASEGVNTIVIDRLGPGGQAAGSSKIENFIGFPSGLSGAELATRGVLQMLKFGAKMIAPVEVDKIVPCGDDRPYHQLHLDCGHVLQARTILLAAGVKWRRLEAENAAKYEAAGIHYACTTVEATLYNERDVAVVGAGNSAGQAAMFLAECCRDRTVHMFIRKKLGPGMSDYLVGRIRATPNLKVYEQTTITAVHGGRLIESVTAETVGYDGATVDNAGATKFSRQIPLGAVFVFIGAEPGCGWLPEGIARDELGYIYTGVDALKSGRWPLKDREPCPLETTVPGILAAGDIRAGSTKRVGFAVGDGSLAVTCVHKLTAIRR